MRSALHGVRDALIRQIAEVTRASGTTYGDAILVIQPDHLGDVLFSQPAVRQIRNQHPGQQIIGVVGPWSEIIARRTWDVDTILTFPFPGFDRARSSCNPLAPYTMLAEAAGLLRPAGAGTAYILRPDDWWSAWLASTVISGEIITARDNRMDPFATTQVDVASHPHAAQRAFAIAARSEEPSITPEQEPLDFELNADARAVALDKLESAGITGEYVVIHPGAGAEVKTWPAHRWQHVANRLSHGGHAVVLTGSAAERTQVNAIASDDNRAVRLAGETNVEELVEILRMATLVAGPDCGPLHLAVACGTPTVHLFGPSDPAKFGPWGCADRHRVLTAGWQCGRCGDLSPSRPAGCGCMLAIDTEPVTETILEMLDRYAAD